jgi:ABC-type branched-subunit amino acid transport system ATPase component
MLEAKDISVHFGGNTALGGVDFRAEAGQITGLIGPNGAGKTTLFNVMTGLLPPSTGTVSLDGKDISDRSVSRRARLGLGRTFQRAELADSLTVYDNVLLGAETGMAGSRVIGQLRAPRSEHAVSVARTHDAMSHCGIAHLAEVQAGALSTGERRLVELARCLAGNFDLLLLDEPSSGLDPITAASLDATIRRLSENLGVTFVVVTHDLGSIFVAMDRVILLDRKAKGIIASGDPRRLRDESRDPRVRSFFRREVETVPA